MTARWMRLAGRLLLGVFISIAISGCSNDKPMAPTSAAGDANYLVTPNEAVQFAARVATADQNRRMLTFVGQPDTVIPGQNCQIVRLKNGQDTPVPFTEIHPGDSLTVHGTRQQNQNVTANRLQLCQDGAGSYDVAFRDTILSIDYGNNSFTVKNRSEVITVDANTVIWGQLSHGYNPNALGDGFGPNYENTNTKGFGSHDTTLAFADLTVGDVVEVRANTVSEGVLLALTIKIANCSPHAYVEFFSYLASVDAAGKIVTFTDQTWIGWVGQNAKLTGQADETLALADFAAGDHVYVKGFPTTGDTLRICQMSKETL
jgi:hypothetical protein